MLMARSMTLAASAVVSTTSPPAASILPDWSMPGFQLVRSRHRDQLVAVKVQRHRVARAQHHFARFRRDQPFVPHLRRHQRRQARLPPP